MTIIEQPVINIVDLEIYAPTGGFILGVHRFGDEFGDGTETYEWQRYTPNITRINGRRGGIRDGITNSIDVGIFTITLLNDADPLLDYKIRPNVPIRFKLTDPESSSEESSSEDDTNTILYTGKIDDVDVSYSFNKNTGAFNRFVTITTVDAVRSHANTMRYGAGGLDDDESWEDRIDRLAASSVEPINIPPGGTDILKYSLNAGVYFLVGGGSVNNFDGWTRFGGLAANTLEDQWTPGFGGGLIYETSADPNAGSWPRNIAANTYGLKRTVNGLTPGKTYRLNAKGRFRSYYDTGGITAGTGRHVDQYKLGVTGIGDGANGNITGDSVADLPPGTPVYDLPEYEFVATSTSHEIKITMSEAIARAHVGGGLQQFELFREYWETITLHEVAGISDYRLSPIVYESNLVNHFNVACDSVGAFWWVDKLGVTQFKGDLDSEGVAATFSDDTETEAALHYIDITTSYDTRNTANDIQMYNHSMQDDPDNPGNNIAYDIIHQFTNETSIASYGHHLDTIHTSIYTDIGYENAVALRGAELIDQYKRPKKTINQIIWNAQEAPQALAQIDIYSQINVIFDGQQQLSRVVGIRMEVQPTRWLVTLDLAPERGTSLEPIPPL